MENDIRKDYFSLAYNTGTDSWSNLPLKLDIFEHIRNLPKDSYILDVGSGRGIWPFKLAEVGYKVIGIDYVKSVVEKNNQEVKFRGLKDKIRFVEGDIRDIPFEDSSFDAVTDVGLLHHLEQNEWQAYAKELHRVLKPGGTVVIVALSRETKSYFGWMPHVSNDGNFSNEGVPYHFFTKEEINDIFKDMFEIVSETSNSVEDIQGIYFSIVLRKK